MGKARGKSRKQRNYRKCAKLSRYAKKKWRTELEWDKNLMRSGETMKIYRYGFRLWWLSCPDYLEEIGIKREGKYKITNQHGGVMFALPTEINLDEEEAAAILYKCIQKRLTKAQLKVVKKTLSYAYQLQGGEPGKNFRTLPGVWVVATEAKMAPQKHFCVPTRIPRPQQLRQAFTKDWDPNGEMSLIDYSRGLLAGWAWGVCGARSKEDLKRVKKGAAHGFDTHEGWGWTIFQGGRCKMPMAKKGTRPWRLWYTCMCVGRHSPVPDDVEYSMKKDGNPLEKVTWCTACPVNCQELLLRSQWELFVGDKEALKQWKFARIWRKWTKKGRFGASSEGDIVQLAFRWFRYQGIEPDWDTNAGRKSLARWLQHLRVPYGEGMQMHGDLEDVFRKYYQSGLPKSGYTERRQSNDPKIATRALQRFATWCSRGIPPKPKLDRKERLMAAILEGQGADQAAKAYRITHDMPSDDEDDFLLSDCEDETGFAD